MKRNKKNALHLLPVLAALSGFILAGPLMAQTFTTLHSFTASSTNSSGVYTNIDGANPSCGLILSSNTLYGTTEAGGSSGMGTVFKVDTDGTHFTPLYSFTGDSDGATPIGGLILSGSTLYGTTYGGGSSHVGTVFAVNTDGTGFTTLHNFTAPDPLTFINSDGAYPYAELILSSNTLYGTAPLGGSSGMGTLFKVNMDGTEFTTLHSFTLDSDGGRPYAGLILSGNTIYGTSEDGAAFPGNGTVFSVNTDGTAFTTLHSFTEITNSFQGIPYTNIDGANPYGGLILSGNTLYGTASGGGSWRRGTVFAVNTDGTDFTTLHAFTGGSDGASPYAGLILSGNTLYGTARFGGLANPNNGMMFKVNTDGMDFTTLHAFTDGSDGAYPYAGLILSGNTLYGTAFGGGSSGNGVVFRLIRTPQLTIIPSGRNVILSWPTNFTGFALQSTTNLASPIWTTNLPAPVVVNGQNTVTNPISGTQQFFRLTQ